MKRWILAALPLVWLGLSLPEVRGNGAPRPFPPGGNPNRPVKRA